MGKYRIRFFITERKNPFDKTRLDAIMKLLLENPFGTYEQMCLDMDEYDFIAFNANALRREIRRRKYFSVILRREADLKNPEGNLSVTLTSEKNRNSLVLIIDNTDFAASGEVTTLYSFIRNISKLFTRITEGSVRAIEFDAEKYYQRYGLERLNACFGGYIKWIHILGASYYMENGYSKEDLLNAPAFKVEEWENDVIFMMSYESPFSWNEKGIISQIKNLNSYLHEKAEEIQW